ncbi:trigger factor [Rhodobacteraceae bacterium F11138]|nr:trigger factor [Rhodobacteraceae bacterium F11138]
MSIQPRTLTDFRGSWQLEREISHADGTLAAFRGQALWQPDVQGLRYDETGHLTIQGRAPVTACQRYVWQPDLTVWFADGRFFHQVPAVGGATTHWCDPDRYEGVYDFDAWPAFRVIWQVDGPRKSYRMISTYRRA